MKIIVSGGTGLIGKPLVQDRAGDGHDVVVLSRSPKKYDNVFGEHLHLVSWDGRSVGDWVSYIEGADADPELATGAQSVGNTLKPSKNPAPDEVKQDCIKIFESGVRSAFLSSRDAGSWFLHTTLLTITKRCVHFILNATCIQYACSFALLAF